MPQYVIGAPHFYELEYREGDHVMSVEIDLRDPIPCIYKKTLVAWNPPHQDESVPEDKKEEILERLHEWLTRVKKFPRVDIER